MYQDEIKRVIDEEYNGVKTMLDDLNYEELNQVLSVIKNTKGKVIFLGVGKSGHICKKLAATFSSTGTPSFFVHGTEACHGDLGMIEKDDVVILMSNSGTTKEVVQNIEPIKNIGAITIAFTSNPLSYLAINSDYKIIYPHLKEADKLNLAPTVSSTLALVLGDALAIALSTSKEFKKEDFFKFHPNGALGEKLKKEMQTK